jgi:phage gpG-like protein
MIGVRLTGQWKEAVNGFSAYARNLEKAAQRAVGKEAHYFASEIRDGIRTQRSAKEARPPWPPLADSTIAAKGSSAMLINIGTMMNSIIAEKVAKWRWLVGVKRGAKTKDGRNLVNIAAVHEFGGGTRSSRSGGTTVSIPRRQVIAPVVTRLARDLEARLWERFEKEIMRHL